MNVVIHLLANQFVSKFKMTFETLKRYFRWIGILPFKSHPMFGHILSCICGGLLFIYVLTTSWFFIFDAVTFEDYSKSFFYFLSASLGAGWYTMYLTRNTKLGNTFESVDEIIQKSKSKPFDLNFNGKSKYLFHANV